MIVHPLESSASSRIHTPNIKVRSVDSGDSLSEMLDRWRSGDQAAAFAIYDRYYERLIRFAERQIGPKLRPVLTPESVALSVLDSLLKGIAERDYKPDTAGSLMVPAKAITRTKIRKAWEYWTARIRDVRRREKVESLSELQSSQSLPENAITLADELSHFRTLLPPDYFEILAFRLDGLSSPEIAERLGCTRQTVAGKMKRLTEWLRRRAQNPEHRSG
jgi:RNA polymerase sigma factor (sigma-70 family)